MAFFVCLNIQYIKIQLLTTLVLEICQLCGLLYPNYLLNILSNIVNFFRN